ncbi:hypothetical protein OV203_18780 [Nannocystis sp. ILAH1]|uniref:hypothetical protein n=1 Tax=unclassified Nannocystis TaxID=2627009 RepID=UPI00226DB755|nr:MULTISPECIES: hypothetical protein [unclassified Nannocystis]MCY0987052.1 hypothetical protein [Nannocystis sp. ILAH1]MCY0989190.1 hypothetical protein [Nannocystis sp. ILAH1]MCY1071935.1 hypothetical protein [Nannocystis sp. RBIL2]
MTAAKIAVIPLLSVLVACGGGGGESETDDGSTSGSSSETGSSSAPTSSSGDVETGDAPACAPGEGGGALEWSQSAAMLPGFVPWLAAGPDDSVAIAGGTAAGDAVVELRDAAGGVKWTDVYAGAHGLDDVALDVAVDPEGFVHVLVREVILSVQAETMGTTDARLVVLRYAPDGAKLWRWEHERPPVEPWGSYDPEGKLAADGEAITVVEWAFDQPFSHVRLDRFGNVKAETTLAAPETLDFRVRLDVGADGSTAIAARAELPDRLWVGRFDASGAPLWSVDLESEDKPGSVFAADDGAAFLTASFDADPGLGFSARKFTGDGAIAWTQPLAIESQDDIAFGGAVRCDGALVLAGGADKPPQPDNEWGQRRDLWVGLLGPDGALLWSFEHEFGGPFSWGDGNTAAFTSSGAVVVSGSFLGEDGGNYQPWLGRLSGG